MKKTLKFAAALVLAVVGLSFVSCDILAQLAEKGGIEATQNEITRKKQEIITMGMYPQSEKSGNISIESEETVNVNGWDCYTGSDGKNYVKLEVQDFDTGEIETKYYKMEPLKWRVLTNDYNGTGKKLLFCENLIDCCAFIDNTSYDSRTVDGKTIYNNNYKFSRVRAFLNGLSYDIQEMGINPETQGFGYYTKTISDFEGKGFFQLAFTEEEQARIATTRVDNSTGVNSKFKCDDTNDKIFLLSKKEAENTAYGFPSESDELDYPSRGREATDYAHARGVATFYSLRTPKSNSHDSNKPDIWLVGNVKIDTKDANGKKIVIDYRGKIMEMFMSMDNGVVPALCLED